jgi:hypothetical protein
MVAVAGLVLAGCNKTGAPEAGSLDMTVTASIGNLTKVSYSGAATTFTKGDKLSLYAWTGSADEVANVPVVNGVVNTLDASGNWVPATQMLWKNVHDDHFFLAISPAKEIVSFTDDLCYLDQDSFAGSDLLLATSLEGQKFESAPVDMVFTHALAKLNVNLKFRSQWPATPEVTSVATTAKEGYRVNYLTKAVTATGVLTQVKLLPLTTTPQEYALSFSGIQVPQDNVTVITVVIDGKEFIYTAQEPIDLRSGKETTLGLIVGHEDLTLDEVSVTDWGAVDTSALGDLEMQEEGPGIAVGQLIGNDGKNYVVGKLPGGVTAVALICNVSGNHVWALALADEGQMDWETAISTCAAKTPTVPGGTWKLADMDEWIAMITATGGYIAMRDGFSGVGGTNMQEGQYWSSTGNSNTAYACSFETGNWSDPYSDSNRYVRACLELYF